MESLPHTDELRRIFARNLERFDRRSRARDDLTPAAVAVAIVGADGGEAAFVLTRRTKGLRRHGGQWALPGGRLDSGETAMAAALRELREEVGLDCAPSSVLGLLDDFETRSGFRITPVVVWGPSSAALAPDPVEVASAHLVRLRALDAPGVPRFVAGPDASRPLVTIPLESPPTIVFAPTAALIYQLREVVVHGRSTRVNHFGEPRFAWA
jgi:8-oxo-dGTP pyrophosphatase MutT (NUDIX family)